MCRMSFFEIEEEKQYIIIYPDPDQPLAFLQSINTPELSFIIANPFLFFKDYEFDLDEQTKEEIDIEKVEDVTVWGIVSIPKHMEGATINLKAPVIINVRAKKAKQHILHETSYLTKTQLFPQSVSEGGR